MPEIPLEHAQATLNEVIDMAVDGEPQVVTRDGAPVAVVVSMKEWERLSRVPSLGRLLGSAPVEDGDIPPRRDWRDLHGMLRGEGSGECLSSEKLDRSLSEGKD